MWFREYKVWCVSVRKRTHIHCIFPASDENTKKLLYVLQMVIFIIILRERLLSWKILLNITIFLYFHHLRGKLTVNIQWICVRFRTETHQTLYSLNHIFLQNWWEGPYGIKCTLMFSLFKEAQIQEYNCHEIKVKQRHSVIELYQQSKIPVYKNLSCNQRSPCNQRSHNHYEI